MTLYVHRSQRVEDLARSLANVVREGFPADPFASLPIVVGSRGMERWLRVELARELGAVMAIAFPFPEPAFDGATRVLLEGADWAEIGARDPRREADPWDDAALGFRVVTALRELAADPDLEEVRRAHARVALGHLIWHPPGTERHPQIVAWVTAVLERFG